jgi:hypothetical protein
MISARSEQLSQLAAQVPIRVLVSLLLLLLSFVSYVLEPARRMKGAQIGPVPIWQYFEGQ